MMFGGAWGQRKRRNDEAADRRKNRNWWTGAHDSDNRRAHRGPCRWGPIKAGGGALGEIQFRECVKDPRCRRWQSRPYPRPGLGGRPVIPRWTTRNVPRGWW